MLSPAQRVRRLRDDRTAHGVADGGFTLVELLVAIGIASIIGAISIAGFLGASNTTTTTSDSDTATASARTTLQSWGRMLQLTATSSSGGTSAVTSLSPSAITFAAYLNNPGTCTANTACAPLATSVVTLALRNGQLVETIGTGHSSVAETYSTSATGGCLFTAFTTAGPLGCATTLSATQLASITGVNIAFQVSTTSGHTRSFQTTAAFTGRGVAS